MYDIATGYWWCGGQAKRLDSLDSTDGFSSCLSTGAQQLARPGVQFGLVTSHELAGNVDFFCTACHELASKVKIFGTACHELASKVEKVLLKCQELATPQYRPPGYHSVSSEHIMCISQRPIMFNYHVHRCHSGIHCRVGERLIDRPSAIAAIFIGRHGAQQ